MTVACDWLQKGIPVCGNRQHIEASVAINNLVDLFNGDKIHEGDILKLTALMAKHGFGVVDRSKEAAAKTLLEKYLTG